MIKNSIKVKIKVLTVSLLLTATIIFLVLSSNTFTTKGKMANANNNISIEKNISDLVIPTRDSIIKNGYPINESGQTYGPNMENLMLVEPDLLLAKGENGVVGYIYQSEGMSSPSELSEYANSTVKSTSLYLQDGKTIIGTFYFH